jgi:hypothetical protein
MGLLLQIITKELASSFFLGCLLFDPIDDV